MNPIMLLIPIGGVLLVIGAVYFAFGGKMETLKEQESLEALLEFDYPGTELKDLLYDSDRLHAIAYDATKDRVMIFYAHGSHANVRTVTKDQLLQVQLEPLYDETWLRVHLRSFDRPRFDLRFAHDRDTGPVQEWFERLHAMENRT